MTPSLQFDQRSVAQLHRNLNLLPKRVAIKHMRIGLNAAGGVAKKTAAARSARETNLLSKSHIVSVIIPDASKNPEHHGKPARVIIGPSRRVVRWVRRTAKGLRTIGAKTATKFGIRAYRKPTRYAHLAERKSPAIAAAQRTLETDGMNKLYEKLSQGITQEAAALAK